MSKRGLALEFHLSLGTEHNSMKTRTVVSMPISDNFQSELSLVVWCSSYINVI